MKFDHNHWVGAISASKIQKEKLKCKNKKIDTKFPAFENDSDLMQQKAYSS